MKAVFSDVGGLRTRYFTAGTGPLLLLVHPVGYPAEIWARNVDALAARHTVVAPDLPGQGHSEAPAAWSVAPQVAMAQHVASLARALGHERFSIAGSSLGGLVAALVALHHPERVDRLVIVGSGSVFNDPATQPAVLRTVYANGSRAYADPSLAACRARIANTCLQPPDADDILLTQTTAYALPGAAAAYKALIDGLIATVTDPAASVHPHLERIAAPTLVIVGREDPRTSIEAHRAGTRRIDGAHISIYDQCGHLPFLEHAPRFNADLERWLAGETVGERPAAASPSPSSTEGRLP